MLCRLYASRPWPASKWIAEGAHVALEAALLADMWGLEPFARHAAAAVRVSMLDPAVGKAVRRDSVDKNLDALGALQSR